MTTDRRSTSDDHRRLRSLTMGSPIGALTLVASGAGLRAVLMEGERPGRVPSAAAASVDDAPMPPGASDASGDHLAQAARELAEYFAGRRTEFGVALDPVGTPFQQEAWLALRSIGYGETVTYAEQARRMGDVRKARAVGLANGRNPIGIIVPCHRVVGADGSLTGYAGGVEKKAYLLDHERGVRAAGS